MTFRDRIFQKAQGSGKTLVLAEGQDERVAKAAEQIAGQELAKVIVLATPAEQEQSMKDVSYEGLDVQVIDHSRATESEQLARLFYDLRSHKGVTYEKACETVKDRLYFGNLMLRAGMADGLVAGSIASTSDMMRAALRCVGTTPTVDLASSCFVMDLESPAPNGEEVLVYADCGLNACPNADQLVDIAVSTARTRQLLLGDEPRIAFLSFSTKGSADHELVTKMVRATQMTQERVIEEKLPYEVDGELQADAALVPAVGEKKAPNSSVAGKANVVIFPDLQAGNICYKMTERLARAEAFGPLVQGMRFPVNDLSRGCSAEDIVGVGAITVCQGMEE